MKQKLKEHGSRNLVVKKKGGILFTLLKQRREEWQKVLARRLIIKCTLNPCHQAPPRERSA
jgi:hypothetical protein